MNTLNRQCSFEVTNSVMYLVLMFIRFFNLQMWCYLPAVRKYPRYICHRNQHKHFRHGASYIVPVHVHIDKHTSKCTETIYEYCYHIRMLKVFIYFIWTRITAVLNRKFIEPKRFCDICDGEEMINTLLNCIINKTRKLLL